MDVELATMKRDELKAPSRRILDLHAEKQKDFRAEVTQMDVIRPTTPEEQDTDKKIVAVNNAVFLKISLSNFCFTQNIHVRFV